MNAAQYNLQKAKINVILADKAKAIGQKVMEAKALWLDSLFLKILPVEVYQWGHGSKEQQERARKWLDERGYRVLEDETRICLMKGADRVEEFRFQFDLKKPISHN